LRQSLDTVGAFVGPLLATGLMILLMNDIRTIFWIAAVPSLIAVILIVFGVRDIERPTGLAKRGAPLRLIDLREMPRGLWVVIGLGFILTLARFSEAFLILKASAEGLPLALAPMVLVVMNLIYAGGAYPAGHFADRMAPHWLLGIGISFLIAADIVLATASGLVGVTIGIILWGAHMALTQGLLAKLVADHAPPDLRGSAFGAFHLATGVALLLASVIAGLLWDGYGANATFFAGAGFAAVALLLTSRYPKLVQRDRA
jgi:MFS family permease